MHCGKDSWDTQPVKTMEAPWNLKRTILEGNESIFQAHIYFVHLSMRNFLLYALVTTWTKIMLFRAKEDLKNDSHLEWSKILYYFKKISDVKISTSYSGRLIFDSDTSYLILDKFRTNSGWNIQKDVSQNLRFRLCAMQATETDKA